MKRATREFIKARQPHCQYRLMVITNVRQEPTGTPGDPVGNVEMICQQRPQDQMVPGWLVGTRETEGDQGTWITPHWWMCRSLADGFEHYDITPGIAAEDFEYVIDRDMFEFTQDPIWSLSSVLPDHIYYEGGRWWSVDCDQDPPARVRLMDLTTGSVFTTRRSSIITLDI